MAKCDLGYYNGLIASAYKTLIPRDKLLRLADSGAEEIVRSLKEQGYSGDENRPNDYNAMLEAEREKLLAFVREGNFGREVNAFCLLKNDYHNAECVVRERYMGDLGNVYVPVGLYPVEKLKISVLGRKTDITPGMQAAIEQASAAYENNTASGSEISTIFARNYYSELIKSLKNKRLKKIARFDVDAKNCAVALRSRDFKQAESMLLPGGTLTKQDLEVLLGRDERAINLRFAYTPLYDYVRIAVEETLAGKPMRAFEKAADEYALAVMDDVRYESQGITPIIMYYLYKNAEIKNVRAILSLKTNGLGADEIALRLRSGYVG